MILVIIKTFKEFFRDLYYRNITTDEAKRKQNEFDGVLNTLNVYSAKKKEYIDAKNKLLDNANNFYKGRENFFERFENGISR